MGEEKILCFFRVDNPEIRKMVEGLGDLISRDDSDRIIVKSAELNLDYSVCCPCMTGSQKAIELAADKRYVSKEYKR